MAPAFGAFGYIQPDGRWPHASDWMGGSIEECTLGWFDTLFCVDMYFLSPLHIFFFHSSLNFFLSAMDRLWFCYWLVLR